MPLFYHYTDDEGANNIIRSGKILASLTFKASDIAAFGNGVYLTKLKPPTSTKAEVAQNNWMQTSEVFVNKTKNYFVVDLPDKDVKEVEASGRNIFLFGHGNDLNLLKFPWWLKEYDSGKILVSYKYQVSSLGPATIRWGSTMGDYKITDETVNGSPVFKGKRLDQYLYMTNKGSWCVGKETEENKGWFSQKSKYSLGPDSTVSWEYFDPTIDYNGKWNCDDVTLKVSPWQI